MSAHLLGDDVRHSAKRMVICLLVCPGKEVISPRILLISASRQHNDARSAAIIIAIQTMRKLRRISYSVVIASIQIHRRVDILPDISGDVARGLGEACRSRRDPRYAVRR